MPTGGPHLFFLFLESDLWSVRNFLTKACSALRSSLFHPRYVAQRRFRVRLMVLIWRAKSAVRRRGALAAARLAIKPFPVSARLTHQGGLCSPQLPLHRK